MLQFPGSFGRRLFNIHPSKDIAILELCWDWFCSERSGPRTRRAPKLPRDRRGYFHGHQLVRPAHGAISLDEGGRPCVLLQLTNDEEKFNDEKDQAYRYGTYVTAMTPTSSPIQGMVHGRTASGAGVSVWDECFP